MSTEDATGSTEKLRKILTQQRWSAEDARVVLEAAAACGLSLGKFAAQYDIAPKRLYRWRQELAGANDRPQARFREVKLQAQVQGYPFEVVLRSGHVLRVSAAFDAEDLSRVVATLEGTGR